MDARLNPTKIDLDEARKAVSITCELEDRTYHLLLPDNPENAGTIRISKNSGDLLPERLLPSGVMPHGQDGVRSLERWDGAYRRDRMPGWDVGRPATELKKAVERGALKPGRALVLGCGTGTNAIFLAKNGFDVAGVDVAPTALTLAADKARKAKVKVRWMVADVAALPDMAPFDVIFDRGCYHHVRTYNAKCFAGQMKALSRPGTRMMILAGNANEARHYGPPRVEETDMVGDFAADWDFIWLKEIRFDSPRSGTPGSTWAWSMLLRRKADKNK